jgi:hypothetical protein
MLCSRVWESFAPRLVRGGGGGGAAPRRDSNLVEV